MSFPHDFLWGASTAAYQIEGAALEDGKGPSTWDVYSHHPGIIYEGNTADVSCDHYHRYQEDVAIMRAMGLRAYRFSFSWARIMPDGSGQPNKRGLDFYDRLIDALIGNGIQPCATLFHGDPPYPLHLQGGWLNRSIADRFAEYADVVARRFSDRVKIWFTFNEPQYLIHFGYHVGGGAPGVPHTFKEVLTMAHHVLLAHGKAVQAVRSASSNPVKIGAVTVGNIYIPASSAAEDIAAARTRTFETRDRTVDTNAWWLDPMYRGGYPEDGIRAFGPDMVDVSSRDMDTIYQPLDFFGANFYSIRGVVAAGPDGTPRDVPRPVGHSVNASGQDIVPEAMYWGPRFYHERYGLPVFVTENGMTNVDFIYDDGSVHDPQRIEFTKWYLRWLGRAIDDGVPVVGYMHWSLMDNFEWTSGYKSRFGLVYVDFPSQRRILKDSAHWYRGVIESNGSSL